MDLGGIREQVLRAASRLLSLADLRPGHILVVGCSTSEVQGKKIGSAGSTEVAAVIVDALLEVTRQAGVYLAIQCCEHLNRALVVEEEAAARYDLEIVTVVPTPKAGGSAAAAAMDKFTVPVVVEEVKAHAGMDIGDTLIGMHLRKVAVPVRLDIDRVGEAHLTLARTRPKLIGGERAVYRK